MEAEIFENEIVKNAKSLKAAAWKFTGNADDANDLVQETLLKALANREKFREGPNVGAWLYTIMRNTAITATRKVSRFREFSQETTGSDTWMGSNKFGPEENARFGELNKSLEKMSPDLRETFRMHYEGFKYHEIAEMMLIPIGTVKSRIFQARQVLQKELRSYSLSA